MRAGFTDYLRAAFNAKPLGMFVAPNWIALAAFALVGFVNPGFWILGLGLELGYLLWLSGNARFRRVVDARLDGDTQRDWQARLGERVSRLSAESGRRFHSLDERCRTILAQQQRAGAMPELQAQAEGLGRLLWIYLGLLQTRETLRQMTEEAGDGTAEKLRRLEKQLAAEDNDDVRKSLAGQVDILKQRTAAQKEARSKIDFLDAELGRIEEQVELIREQSVLAADPATVSRRIDEVGSTLSGTTQWIRDQQKIFGEVQDVLDEAPAIPFSQSTTPTAQ